jgi:hypothetical protein
LEEKLAALERLEPLELASSSSNIENSIETDINIDDKVHTISNVLLKVKTAEKQEILTAIANVSQISMNLYIA